MLIFNKSAMVNSQSEIVWPPKPGVDDPYIDLEELDSPAVHSWVSAQTARTMAMFGHTPGADALTRRLAEATTAQDQIVICSRWGNWAYNTWLDDAHPLGVVRRTP